MIKTKNSTETVLIISLIIAMLLWGTSWVSGKIIAEMAPTKVTTFYRLAIATLSMLPILFVVRRFKFVTLKFSRNALLWSLPAGALLAGYNQLFFLGLHNGLPGKGGMLVTTINPLFTFLLTSLVFQQKLKVVQGMGLTFGLIGGLFMIEIWSFNLDQLLASGNLYFILAAFTWAILTIISQIGGRYADFLLFSTFMYGFASLISYGFAYSYSPLKSMVIYSLEYWLHMAFLSTVVVSVATSIFFLATQQLGSSRSSSFIFVVPTSAMGLSAWYFGETLSAPVACGGVLAISAVYLLNFNKGKVSSN
ncbi:DMT family transporter [Pseudoalteromonas sp. MMG005]|uniref:DMT family transporter n=1 Tax=Pseudoalteromonas sp. MMG005 TaxID=2822682 RepID=UPI001B3A7B29|nr:DMT family transporter [Pseudoalteromonas sp. MMG005]MBQ4844447.1 DMT family transporter [Pseudoalteromonas sp. MMG005]